MQFENVPLEIIIVIVSKDNHLRLLGYKSFSLNTIMSTE